MGLVLVASLEIDSCIPEEYFLLEVDHVQELYESDNKKY